MVRTRKMRSNYYKLVTCLYLLRDSEELRIIKCGIGKTQSIKIGFLGFPLALY